MADIEIIYNADKSRQSWAVCNNVTLFALSGDPEDEQSEGLLREGSAGVRLLGWRWDDFKSVKGTRGKKKRTVSQKYLFTLSCYSSFKDILLLFEHQQLRLERQMGNTFLGKDTKWTWRSPNERTARLTLTSLPLKSSLICFLPKICGCNTSRMRWETSASQRTVERSTGEPWSFWRATVWKDFPPNILFFRPDTSEWIRMVESTPSTSCNFR